jgi:hypothetical protein
MSVIVGRDAAKTQAAVEKLGWAGASADWRDGVARDGRQPELSFDDGLQVQQVLHAVERSAADNETWTASPKERHA